MPDRERLLELVQTLGPEDLYQHDDLAGVYRAASAIALASYNGHLSTSPVEGLDVDDEPLVRSLLGRYTDRGGFVKFPHFHQGRVGELIISSAAASRYALHTRDDPETQTDVVYFSVL